jgi:single-strand DNA-binding protein
MTIDCAFFGFLAADADARTSKAGKPWTRLRVGVGRDDVQWVNVACFGKAAETAATLKKGGKVYVEGTIKLDVWRGDDGTERRHTLAVAAFKCERTHNIGRNGPRKDRLGAQGSDGNDFYSDPIPFAPDWRA